MEVRVMIKAIAPVILILFFYLFHTEGFVQAVLKIVCSIAATVAIVLWVYYCVESMDDDDDEED